MKEMKMKILFKQNDVKFDQKIAPAICNKGKIPSEMEVALLYTHCLNTVYTFQTASHCKHISMYAFIYIVREG